MKQSVYRRLEELERMQAAAWQARAGRNGRPVVEIFRQLITGCGIEQLPETSLAEEC
jgi:hypothetical protein